MRNSGLSYKQSRQISLYIARKLLSNHFFLGFLVLLPNLQNLFSGQLIKLQQVEQTHNQSRDVPV
jgi:hypothetical protein